MSRSHTFMGSECRADADLYGLQADGQCLVVASQFAQVEREVVEGIGRFALVADRVLTGKPAQYRSHFLALRSCVVVARQFVQVDREVVDGLGQAWFSSGRVCQSKPTPDRNILLVRGQRLLVTPD